MIYKIAFIVAFKLLATSTSLRTDGIRIIANDCHNRPCENNNDCRACPATPCIERIKNGVVGKVCCDFYLQKVCGPDLRCHRQPCESNRDCCPFTRCTIPTNENRKVCWDHEQGEREYFQHGNIYYSY